MATTKKTGEGRRRAAKAFVERWTYRRGSEKGEDQQFWNDLLRSVLGAEDVEARIRYQVPVPMRGTTKFLDAWIPETRVLVEHKSRGVDLAAPQSGHGGLTPYEQAAEYDAARRATRYGVFGILCPNDVRPVETTTLRRRRWQDVQSLRARLRFVFAWLS